MSICFPPASGQCGVATAFPDATEAAVQILRLGGNAIDAAVAAAWALCACEPSASGLGGQTTLLIRHPNGRCRVIDGHSYAPSDVSRDTVSAAEQRRGRRATTVPSTPATLAYAQKHYGVVSLSDTLAPAIRIADDGYRITALQHRQFKAAAAHFRADPAARNIFLPGDCPPRTGMLFRQPALARTLIHFAENGVDDFYHGRMARLIADDMRKHGGLLSESDLAIFALPLELEPLETEYRGLTVVSAGPPAGGLHAHAALARLEELLSGRDGEDEDRWYESIALATYGAFSSREAAAAANSSGAHSVPLAIAEGPGDTTHVSISDASGSVVALTQSIQSVFGAKAAHADLGFLYNNYLWTCPRTDHPHALASRCRPRSNVAPTIIMKPSTEGGTPILALGAAGSRRITSSILQVISNVTDRGMTIAQAVSAPRVHARLSRGVWIERGAFTPRLVSMLSRHFDRLDIRSDWNYKLGCVQALHWTGEGLSAMADPRRDGTARTIELGLRE